MEHLSKESLEIREDETAFETVLPDYDKERVYVSNIKKYLAGTIY